MDPRLIVVIAALFVTVAGYVCVAPDQVPFLRLPQQFAQLGLERTVTGVALMLLGFLVALSELEDEKRPARARRGQPFAFGGEDMAVADGELRLEPEPVPSRPDGEPAPDTSEEPRPADKRRPDLYEELDEKPLAVIPKRDTPEPSPEP
jgi:hypothetical protein